MSEQGVDKKAEMLERTWKVGGGTTEGPGTARPTLTAHDGLTDAEVSFLLLVALILLSHVWVGRTCHMAADSRPDDPPSHAAGALGRVPDKP